MSKIIVFGNQKGGVGKTTCTVLAATALSQPPFGLRVAVVDADPQKSIAKGRLLDMEDFNGPLPYDVLGYNVPTFEQRARDLDQRHDLVFVDVAGKLDTDLPPEQQEISRVLLYADFLFVPFSSGNYALDATLDYLRFVLRIRDDRAQSARPLQVVGFVNMYRERSRNGRFLVGELEQIRQVAGVPFMRNNLSLYTLFSEASTTESLYDAASTHNDRANLSQWVDELIDIIK
jgi:chromosome partitioning protein